MEDSTEADSMKKFSRFVSIRNYRDISLSYLEVITPKITEYKRNINI